MNWLVSDHQPKKIDTNLESANIISSSLAPFSHNVPTLEENQNSIHNFFVPGWKGDSLPSKSLKKFNEILNKIHLDVKTQFFIKDSFSRKLKISLYNDFISYAEFKALNCSDLDHYTAFWSELKSEHSKYRDSLDDFIEIFSFRVAVIYILKIRFLIILHDKTGEKFDIKNAFYPNSCLTKIFKTASSLELKAQALEQNVFSWFKPNDSLKNEILIYKNICKTLNITEIIKSISTKSEDILNTKSDYSHSLSHKSFGLFLNSLLINFPSWLEKNNHKRVNNYKSEKTLEIISTKFAGDNLESLALSHWLAQDHNKNIKWDQILCPDFKKATFNCSLYLKIVNELQFLTFLADISSYQDKEAKTFISNVVNSHLYNRKNSSNLQKTLLLNDDNHVAQSTYDRIILNLSNFPKNNPQHFLFNQISAQKPFLKDNGLIYVITNKKLFVPSQKSKVESLLQIFKIQGLFDLSNISGKGELGSYIYIFSPNNPIFPESDGKQTCYNFRFSSNLETFQEFHNITAISEDFFNANLYDVPPLYHKAKNNTKLEFFQDAIVNGQFIHSSKKDSGIVTHPHFFKNLMGMCEPLDFFFDIQNVNFDENDITPDSFFDFSNSFKRDQSPYTLVIDKREKDLTKLEVISTNSLEAKAYEYGHTLCSYFYAYPKWPGIDIMTVKNFFDSSIGQQIINLTFSNEVRKIKGNLNKLLLPKYLIGNEAELPEHIKMGLTLYSLTPEEILNLHPTELDKKYNETQNILNLIVKKYPAQILKELTRFKMSVQKACDLLGGTNKKLTGLNFNNPILKSPLLLSKTYPLYPDNKDVYIEFNSDNLNSIHEPLLKYRSMKSNTEGVDTCTLQLFVEHGKVISLYSDEDMIKFIEFLLSNTINYPVSAILQSVQIPKLDDLKSIISSFNSMNTVLRKLSDKTVSDFDTLINNTIYQS